MSQLAQDEGSAVRGFGVVEYESAEQAEAMLMEMDHTPLGGPEGGPEGGLEGGPEVRLSLCSPGTSGRSTLAALIAAQGVVREPTHTHVRKHTCTHTHTHTDRKSVV